ncbi:hypothetical protein FD755_005818 [Muntiacus reevesi]|uniref:Roadblock/LAMTOR2 domain-containing protein n=2 Tax=Muntiacus TaxID=9885 RepID=A0A5J5MTS0_MUNRE|nr:hypothetical protein FD754_012473 [Muntiacus muntjak]KAB0383901.1 hypothetical protein FD755_005818 [Muntiacus reevesi]
MIKMVTPSLEQFWGLELTSFKCSALGCQVLGEQWVMTVNCQSRLWNSGCIPIKSTMDNPTTTQYANLMHNFILKARSTVREIDPQNDLTFLRIRSKKNEIMVAPVTIENRITSESFIPKTYIHCLST